MSNKEKQKNQCFYKYFDTNECFYLNFIRKLLYKGTVVKRPQDGKRESVGGFCCPSPGLRRKTVAMTCWARLQLESRCTVSTSSSSQDPSDAVLLWPAAPPDSTRYQLTRIPCSQ